MLLESVEHVNQVKIGWWYCYCCEEDLEQVENENQLENLGAWALSDPTMGGFYKAWPSLGEALLDLECSLENFNKIQELKNNKIDPGIYWRFNDVVE